MRQIAHRYLSDMLAPKKQVRTTRSFLKVNILDIPKTIPNNGYTAKAFSVAGPRLWNNTLDDELRGCTNVELFKKKQHYCLSHFINTNIVLTIVTYM